MAKGAQPRDFIKVPKNAKFFGIAGFPTNLVVHKMYRLSTTSARSIRPAARTAQPLLTRGAHKEIKFSNEGRAGILKGVDVLANAVSVTLGPKGESAKLLNMDASMNTGQVATSSLNSLSADPRLQKVSPHLPVPMTRWWMRTRLCKMLTHFLDGVTVAKSITLQDKFENLGARYVPSLTQSPPADQGPRAVLSRMLPQRRTRWLVMVLQRLLSWPVRFTLKV